MAFPKHAVSEVFMCQESFCLQTSGISQQHIIYRQVVSVTVASSTFIRTHLEAKKRSRSADLHKGCNVHTLKLG